RRFQLRCELDAAFFHLYLGTGEWRQAPGEAAAELARLRESFPIPRHAVEHVLDTFPLVQKADEERHGCYRTKDRILHVYDEMATGRPYVSPLAPVTRPEDREPEARRPLGLFGDPMDGPTSSDLVIQAF